MRWAFVAIAGADVGYGHLSRCITLANGARRRGIDSSFWLYGDANAAQWIDRAGYPSSVYPLSTLATQPVPQRQDVSERFDAIVVDLSHPVVFRNIAGSRELFQYLRERTKTVIVIDTLGERTLATSMPDMLADVLVVPYVGAVADLNAPWQTFAGPQYAVLAPAYADLPVRKVRADANRVLISCGGSDPKRLTLAILNGVEQLSLPLEIRVIVGQLFDKGFVDELTTHAANSLHSIELIHAPDGLSDHMLWCDLAIAASGLIKYELAASSTPAILFSIDRDHDVVNRPFVRQGSVRDLGVEFNPHALVRTVSELLGDLDARSAMAAAGRRLVDGKGAERLIADIIRTNSVTN